MKQKSAPLLWVMLLGLTFIAGCSTGDDAVSRGSSFEFVSPGGQIDIFYEAEQRQKVPPLAGEDLMNEGKQLSIANYPGSGDLGNERSTQNFRN